MSDAGLAMAERDDPTRTPREPTLPGGHPKGLAVLFLTEMAERLSFYTVKNQLTLYLTTVLLVSEHAASSIYGTWGGLTWFMPFFGGIIADRFWGAKKAVLWGGLVFFLGHLLLGLSDLAPGASMAGLVPGTPESDHQILTSPHFMMFAIGLLVVACGNGLFKGNISVLVGALYDRADRRSLRDQAFQIFYIGINFGAIVAPFSAPWIISHFAGGHGWSYSFGSAAVAIAISFSIFALGRKLLVDRGPSGPTAKQKLAPLTRAQKLQMAAVCAVLVMSALYWSVYFQDGLALTLFAKDHTKFEAWGWNIEDLQKFQAINPAGILLLTPVFVLIWRALDRRRREPSTLAKMSMGLAVLGLGMLVMTYASVRAESAPDQKVSPWFLAITFVFQTVSELFLSPMGLSFVTQYAPPGRTGLMMGLWFASLAAGTYATGVLNRLGLGIVPFYGLLAGLMIGGALLLMLLMRLLQRVLAGNAPAASGT